MYLGGNVGDLARESKAPVVLRIDNEPEINKLTTSCIAFTNGNRKIKILKKNK